MGLHTLFVSVLGRWVTSSNRGSISSLTSSGESISLRLGLSLTFDNTVVDQTSTMTDSLNSWIVGPCPSVTTGSLLELSFILPSTPGKLYCNISSCFKRTNQRSTAPLDCRDPENYQLSLDLFEHKHCKSFSVPVLVCSWMLPTTRGGRGRSWAGITSRQRSVCSASRTYPWKRRSRRRNFKLINSLN